MKLQSINRYEAYKDSGVEWLGDVPAHWEVSRIKNLGILSRGVDLARDVFKEGTYPVYGSNGIIGYHSEYTTKGPCLTVGRSGSVGEINYVHVDFWAHNTALYLQKKFNNDIRFIFFRFHSLNLQSFSAGSAVGTLNRNVIHQLITAIPPLPEQQAIANYLDTKTAQIDRKLDLLSQKATQYGKLKQSLINETVTRGLDKTVAMKDSGVEWIGEVPAHWILNRHKDNFSFVAGRCTNSSLTKVGLENIEGKTGRFISTDTQFDGDGVEFKKNDILFGKLRPYLAKVYLSEFNGNAVGDIFVYRPTRNTKPKFALYLMLSDKYIDVINSSTAGAKMPRVGSNFIANLPVSIPSKQEQQAIVVYLDDKTTHIDRIVSTINTQIDKLKELRKALINDVVTGKICVLPESAQKL